MLKWLFLRVPVSVETVGHVVAIVMGADPLSPPHLEFEDALSVFRVPFLLPFWLFLLYPTFPGGLSLGLRTSRDGTRCVQLCVEKQDW